MNQRSCQACELNADPEEATGGRIYATQHWYLEHIVAPLPLVGWLILKTIRHTEGIVGLNAEEGAELGRLLEVLPKVLAKVSGAEQVYVCVFTEVVAHLHIHLIPRAAGQSVRGPKLFLERITAARDDPQSCPAPAEAAAFAESMRVALAGVE
jgi:diadenosine tetraphosphate (Ap4A) HIT family hydrolase